MDFFKLENTLLNMFSKAPFSTFTSIFHKILNISFVARLRGRFTQTVQKVQPNSLYITLMLIGLYGFINPLFGIGFHLEGICLILMALIALLRVLPYFRVMPNSGRVLLSYIPTFIVANLLCRIVIFGSLFVKVIGFMRYAPVSTIGSLSMGVGMILFSTILEIIIGLLEYEFIQHNSGILSPRTPMQQQYNPQGYPQQPIQQPYNGQGMAPQQAYNPQQGMTPQPPIQPQDMQQHYTQPAPQPMSEYQNVQPQQGYAPQPQPMQQAPQGYQPYPQGQPVQQPYNPQGYQPQPMPNPQQEFVDLGNQPMAAPEQAPQVDPTIQLNK